MESGKLVAQIRPEMKASSDYALGPLPWSEELLRKAYFSSFTSARKAIEEHPGFTAHQALCSLGLSLDIFLDSVSELLKSIETFRKEAQSREFWNRPARNRFKSRELAIRRDMVAAATNAMALVDHSRRMQKKSSLADYKKKLDEVFDAEEHRFVQSLRICVGHIRMIEADWQVSHSVTERRTQFLLRQGTLLQWDGWDKEAKTFIDRHPDGIDIEELFKSYRDRVERFHVWFHNEVAQVSEPELSEYRKYERVLARFGLKAQWNLILEQVIISGRLDPFTYLDQYLAQAELDEVLALPMRSRVQVDRIIKILDEYEACDEELRGKVYRAFKVDVP